MDVYYLLAWCEDSSQWHEADECEATSWRKAKALLRGRNPMLVQGGITAVVHHDDLNAALKRNPQGKLQQLAGDLVAA